MTQNRVNEQSTYRKCTGATLLHIICVCVMEYTIQTKIILSKSTCEN